MDAADSGPVHLSSIEISTSSKIFKFFNNCMSYRRYRVEDLFADIELLMTANCGDTPSTFFV